MVNHNLVVQERRPRLVLEDIQQRQWVPLVEQAMPPHRQVDIKVKLPADTLHLQAMVGALHSKEPLPHLSLVNHLSLKVSLEDKDRPRLPQVTLDSPLSHQSQ